MSDLGALRRAGQVLEPARVVAVLARTFAAWRAPDSLWRARLVREHGTYSRPVLERAVCGGLEHWTAAALETLLRRELPDRYRAPPVTAVWLAGSIPTSAFAAIALPLLAGSPVYVKPSSADPVSPELFADSLRAVDPELARAVRCGDGAGVLESADAVVAYGRDETLAEIREQVDIQRPFIGYGHRLSVGCVGREADLSEAARALALDAALYDGRGCLSPAYVFVEDDPPGRGEALGAALADALDHCAKDLPPGRLEPSEHAWLHDVRGSFAARGDARVWLPRGSSTWSVVLSRFEHSPPFAGQLRALPLIAVRDLRELSDWCSALAPHLSSLAHAGFGERVAELGDIALAAGGSRLCPLGRLQFPPLEWHHDGRDALRDLVRVLDCEE